MPQLKKAMAWSMRNAETGCADFRSTACFVGHAKRVENVIIE
jgi:hypothetical protein